ncbi:hypothetical protein QUB10_33175 [Microcoleus sp. B5-D4]|uniref:hypothetical protein n=1 Tax=Microcoleus sp. B5-D4 TaxID=2818681 RepID=UPI002FD067EC
MAIIWTPTGITEIESAEDLFYVDIDLASASQKNIELMIQTNVAANNWINGGKKIDDYLDCLSDGGYDAYEFLISVEQSLTAWF